MSGQSTQKADPEDRLGMSEEQGERFQAYTYGFGEQDENGVDISLLRENLRLTPSQRLESGLWTLARNQSGAIVGLRLGFDSLAQVLHQQNVRYLLTGDLAMRCHGSAYVVRDQALYYARDARNLAALADALAPLHPRLRDADEDQSFRWDVHTLRGGTSFALVTDAGNVDLLGRLPGVTSFETLWQRSSEIALSGVPVRVVSLNDLIAMKRASDHTHDLLHLMELERLRILLAERQLSEPEVK
jgi:hypothetical protein